MADDCRVPPDRQEWDKLLKDLNLTPSQNQGSGRGGRGGGRCGNRGGGGGGGAGQQRGWPQQQQPFRGNPEMYSIQDQQFLPPPSMLLPPDDRRRRRTPVPSSHYAMGSPSESAATTAIGTVTSRTAARSLRSTRPIRPGPQQPVRGDVRRLQLVTFMAVGTGHSPGGSAYTHHDPFVLLCDERRHHRLYGQINTINTLGLAAARTKPTLLVKLGRFTSKHL